MLTQETEGGQRKSKLCIFNKINGFDTALGDDWFAEQPIGLVGLCMRDRAPIYLIVVNALEAIYKEQASCTDTELP